jgi:hypothetical protein
MMRAMLREERRRPNAFHLCQAREVRAPREHVFEFLTTRVPDCYTLLSRGHERFVVEGGGPLRLGARIDCREHAGTQVVHHTYEVREIRAPEHLFMASTPTRTWVRAGARTIEGSSDTYVYYDLEEADGGRTRLDMTIVIELPSLGKKWMAAVLGRAHGLWSRHQGEELDRLVTLVEATAPGGPMAVITRPGRDPGANTSRRFDTSPAAPGSAMRETA